jgi:hypothetical protein
MSRADERHADPGSEGVSGLSHGPGDYVPGVGRLPRLWSKDEGAERKPDVRPPRGSAPVPSSGIFGLGVVVAVALLGWPSVAQVLPEDQRRSALDDFVAARMLATKCPSWQLNLAEIQGRFSALNLKPADWQDGGAYAHFFDERLIYYSGVLSRMSERRACEAAAAAFGPSGQVRRDWMRPQ